MSEKPTDTLSAQSYHFNDIQTKQREVEDRLKSLKAESDPMEVMKLKGLGKNLRQDSSPESLALQADENVTHTFIRTYIENHILLGLQKVAIEQKVSIGRNDEIVALAQELAVKNALEQEFDCTSINENTLEQLTDRAWVNLKITMDSIRDETAGKISKALDDEVDESNVVKAVAVERLRDNPDTIRLNPEFTGLLKRKNAEYRERCIRLRESGKRDSAGYIGARYRQMITEMLLNSDDNIVYKNRILQLIKDSGTFDNELFEQSWVYIWNYNDSGQPFSA